MIFVYSNLFTSGSISTWRVAKRFFIKFSVSSSITRLGVILCLHLSSLTLYALYLLLLAYGYSLESSFDYYLVLHLDKLE